MQIHVISSGQTLYEIANAYGTTASALASVNEIDPNLYLIVGQTLVIPITGIYYWVQKGDSLNSISNKFNININTLAQINGLSIYKPLPVKTRIYIPPQEKRSIEVNSYVEPFGNEVSANLENSVIDAAQSLTYLSPFSFKMQRDGSLSNPLLNNFANIASYNGVSLMMVISNLENGEFSSELARTILTNENLQNILLENIISTANKLNFRDIHFDIENIRPEDKEIYNNFLRKVSNRIHLEGFLMSTALAPKTSSSQSGAWYAAHDYNVHGEVSDFVVIMTYEWGYSRGPAMAISPIGPVRKVLEYAITQIPANKILMGQNLYGYDWLLPFVQGKSFAKSISPQQAINLARDYNVKIEYDYTSEAPHFRYIDNENKTHEVWFEDARSISAKFNLIKGLGIRGISYWKLGISFPQNWLLLEDNFNIFKRN